MIERTYTIQETAEVLRKSVKTVRRYVRDGLLPVLRSGPRSFVVSESELKKFMQPDAATEESRVFNLLYERSNKLH